VVRHGDWTGSAMSRLTKQQAILAVSLSGLTAIIGVLTSLVVWTLRRMSVGSVGGDRDRYDVYFDLMRQSEAALRES